MALPKWNLLLAFDAVVRHGSFSRAAAELNVLQPAVSRRVAELESALGVQLLFRGKHGATPTESGLILRSAIVESGRQLEGAISTIKGARPEGKLVVDTTIGFATCYLMRRLTDFRTAHPEIDVSLISRDLNDDFRAETADVVIAFDHRDRLPGAQQVLIFQERMVAVAADVANARVDLREALFGRRLIHLHAGLHKSDWQVFLQGTDLTAPAARDADRYTSFMVYLQAGLNGEGVIIGWEQLMEDYFAAGTLTRICDRVAETERGYFACITQHGLRNEASAHFAGWLAETGEQRGRTMDG